MADQPSTKPTTPPDDMHWVLFLREELREIRQDQREIRQEMRAMAARFDSRLDEVHRRLDSRFALLLVTMVTLFGMTIGFIEYRLPAAVG